MIAKFLSVWADIFPIATQMRAQPFQNTKNEQKTTDVVRKMKWNLPQKGNMCLFRKDIIGIKYLGKQLKHLIKVFDTQNQKVNKL